MREFVGFTVRIPSSVHKEMKKLLKKENKSINAKVRELILEWIREKQEKELFDAFGAVGDESVEYAVEAQKEVVLSNEDPAKR